ncbi:olfactory receptor class A-like protein 1 [Anoplopoma fimbria]|uniref:olfactory receptor class A-like protein 1 n=1 Tax=Anoplopoma fimbria TaxID=229290 RepID=UPI0023EB8F58|nr:olfactory receptor class A-like protein 1 [Anoplopoma fimbria]
MPLSVFVRGMLYLSLTVVGVPGNATVILAFLLLLYHENRLLPSDAIVLHLACVNLLVVGVRCLLETLASFRLASVFGDVGCKVVIFVYRTSRSLSIWLTFVLSAYQCLSIVPPGSRWASVRTVVSQYLGFIFLFLWLLNTCMSSAAILFSFGTKNESSPADHGINVQFCYVRFPSKLIIEMNGAAQVGRDVVPMALMTLASLILLVFLYKHSRQVKGLRSSGGSGGGAEQRAAKAVVALVTLYVVLYGVDNGLWVYTLTVRKAMASSLISDLRIFFSSLYAALSPVIIIASNRKVNGRLRCDVQRKPVQEKDTCLSTM